MLIFPGRVASEKGLDKAIRIAERAGIKIKIAARIDGDYGAQNRGQYYEEVIKPLLDLPHVDYIGEIGDAEKPAFLSGAIALLFPINWPEPFGSVMIEAMACGTPVIGFRHGSVPEVIEDGVTGFIVDDEISAVKAVGKVPLLSREKIRRVFEERFTARIMAEKYVKVYEELIQKERNKIEH